ncbi:hypothetical protein NEMIN01_0559 [Nematocida minor]|uniref:uncharacterized protein n=1 Tax=Nematocida minor TaxID=1912983 RepID=UPI00221EC651|nr:uncharacterized protein NEMIN01_0559 [Nematocida minor]KAI5189496.1 hypothetical protein NEMIN01_0559 [Nematocida minor]
MKNQELRKILGMGIALLAFFTMACEGSGNPCSKDDASANALSTGGKRKGQKTDSSMDAPADEPKFKNRKKKKEDDPSKEASSASCSQQEIEIMMEDSEQPALDEEMSEPEETGEDKQEGLKPKKIDIRLWKVRRLENKRRKGYKATHQAIYTTSFSDEYIAREAKMKCYQERLKNDIKVFSTEIAPSITESPLWYFIAILSTNIKTKYRDLWTLNALFADKKDDEYRKIVENLDGYYPGLFDDLIAYVKKHQPMRTKKKDPLTYWRETLGDVYIRKEIEPNFHMLEGQKEICQINGKYHGIVHAVRMILMLPEVYEDFSKMSIYHLSKTQTSDDPLADKKNKKILMALHGIVKRIKNNEERTANVYKELYNSFTQIYDADKMLEISATDLYKDIYTALGKFYEEAEVFDENKYILAGKPVIKNQKYAKCVVKSDILSEDLDRRVLSAEYASEEGRWNVSLNVHKHYHVYYVDNTTNQVRLLCMPIHQESESKEELYLHTINDIVEHINELYQIDADSGQIHPFKVKKGTRKWSYIKGKERKQTMKDFAEYEVVFYRIEEDPSVKKFTFAEFRPLDLHEKGCICIPLFLTPLVQFAVKLGPFNKREEHEEIESIEFEDKVPSIYEYNNKNKKKGFSSVHKYYSNLYILPDAEKKVSVDCYTMECQSVRQQDNTIEAVWYVRTPDSVDECTHFIPDETFRKKENLEKFNNFIETLKSREYNKGSDLQGFWLSTDSTGDEMAENTADEMHIWLPNRKCDRSMAKKTLKDYRLEISLTKEKIKTVENEQQKSSEELSSSEDAVEVARRKKSVNSSKNYTKKKLKILYQNLYIKRSERPNTRMELIAFRNVNNSKSNIGANNEILDILITRYNHMSPRIIE